MTVAERIIKPEKAGIFRSIFLYTGQGESTLLVIPNGPNIDDYKYVLVDCDRDYEDNEIDIVQMFKDLFISKGKLSIFINTHPHKDHIAGVKELYDEVGFDEVWHSNHKPGGSHKNMYEELKYVIGKVGKSNEYLLKGSNDLNKVRKYDNSEIKKKIGDIDFQVLSPAEYVCDEINDEKPEDRYRRIHEQCSVIKFTYGEQEKSIMLTGDSDKAAWQNHITDYYKDSLPSIVLSASHHGSRTFFKTDEDDEDIYEKHIESIRPEYVIISAPKDSPHGHPHEDAIKLYKKYVNEENILHLGKFLECVIVDIDPQGNIEVNTDQELIEEYGKDKDDKNNNDQVSKAATSFFIGSQTTRIDDKPQG
ncbi:ComEC/Rec2 family competence protein [Fulvivirgaceae bacterium LMO-SS25]